MKLMTCQIRLKCLKTHESGLFGVSRAVQAQKISFIYFFSVSQDDRVAR